MCSFKSFNVISSLLKMCTNLSEITVMKVSIMRMRIIGFIEATSSFNNMCSLFKFLEDRLSFRTFWEIFNCREKLLSFVGLCPVCNSTLQVFSFCCLVKTILKPTRSILGIFSDLLKIFVKNTSTNHVDWFSLLFFQLLKSLLYETDSLQ
jgi:hypothetical protein